MKAIFEFLAELKMNNNRDWFQFHKPQYEKAKKEFEQFIERLIPHVAKIDPLVAGLSARDCMFRINKDIRFSNDKTPYKTNFGAFIASGGRKSTMAGYYVHIEPGESFLSGGIYMPQSPVLKQLRKEIYENSDELIEIVSNPIFKKTFGEIWGEKLKSAPQGFPRDFKNLEWLKYKHYVVIHSVPDQQVCLPSYLDHAISVFEVLHPFNQFLNQAFTAE